MAYTTQDIDRALRLVADGRSLYAVARETHIPRNTIAYWISREGAVTPRGSGSEREGSCERDGSCEYTDPVDPATYAYALGIYLGDGHIARTRRSWRLDVACDPAYPNVIQEIVSAVGRLTPNAVNTRNKGPCIVVYSQFAHWPCLFPQHGPGRKHERPIVLDDRQRQIVYAHPQLFLRGLIQSDGCRVINRVKRPVAGQIKEYRYLRYSFSNESTDILMLFCDACDLLGIRWKQDGPRNITINRQSEVAFVDTFVGPKS